MIVLLILEQLDWKNGSVARGRAEVRKEAKHGLITDCYLLSS